jgi:hypothetical protein
MIDGRTHWRLKIEHDCHDCAHTVVNTQVCGLSAEKTDECLRGPSRPHWRSKESINPGTGHARTCRCDTCLEYWERQQVEPDRKVRPEVNGESVKDFNRNQEGMPCDFCSHHVNSEPSFCVTCDPENSNYDAYEFSAKIIEQEQKQEPGKKNDHGKPRYDLLPGDVLDEITQIFTGGAEKYGDRNWERGMSWGRVFGAAMRHMWSFWAGRTTDPESGRPHLAHAIVNLMFLLAYYIRGVGTDDREVK